MRSVKDLRRKAAKRAGRKVRVYSTSEARANFAEALETAQVENAVIGFDRYGRTIAALVPIEAIYILAGLGSRIPAAAREEIKDASRHFVENVPSRVSAGQAIERAAPGATKKRARAKRRAKG